MTDWQAPKTGAWEQDKENPYVNWWNLTEADRFRSDLLKNIKFGLAQSIPRESDKPDLGLLGKVPNIPGFEGNERPLPVQMVNPKADEIEDWIPERVCVRPLDPKTVITGVIDEGIALGHECFRHANGQSRILSAWQQNASWEGPEPPDTGPGRQAYLPFGTEIYQERIDTLITECTVGGQLDEARFNRSVGLVDMSHVDGQRTLEMRHAHGTFVADIAGGDTDSALIFTNLPNRDLVGLSGTFLEYFALLGVLRTIEMADRIWEQQEHSKDRSGNEPHGFPIVINLSYSKLAGARDALSGPAVLLALINAARESGEWPDSRGVRDGKIRSKVHLVYPAGNDNLTQGAASVVLKVKGAKVAFEINLPPEDQSSSFIEVWTSELLGFLPPDPVLKIAFLPAGKDPTEDDFKAIENGYVQDLMVPGETRPVARIYSTTFLEGTVVDWNDRTAKADRQRYVLAIGPTRVVDGSAAAMRPGAWVLHLQSVNEAEMTVTVTAQSDQSALPAGATGLRPSIFDAKYQTHDRDTGRVLDSYDYPAGDPDEDYSVRETPRTARHGTINAISSAVVFARDREGTVSDKRKKRSIFVAAGYRSFDGRPALYSSTGYANSVLFVPNASLPTDDSPSLGGILAAGSRDGSKVALLGTSFAAAQATRWIAEYLAHAGAGHNTDAISALEDTLRDLYPGTCVRRPKSGVGRLERTVNRAAPRLAPEFGGPARR